MRARVCEGKEGLQSNISCLASGLCAVTAETCPFAKKQSYFLAVVFGRLSLLVGAAGDMGRMRNLSPAHTSCPKVQCFVTTNSVPILCCSYQLIRVRQRSRLKERTQRHQRNKQLNLQVIQNSEPHVKATQSHDQHTDR